MVVEVGYKSLEEALDYMSRKWREIANKDGIYVPPDVRPIMIMRFKRGYKEPSSAVVRVYLPHGLVIELEFHNDRIYTFVETLFSFNCECGGD